MEESLERNGVSRQKRALPRCIERVPWFAVEGKELNWALMFPPEFPLCYWKGSERRVEKTQGLCGQAGPWIEADPRKQDALAVEILHTEEVSKRANILSALSICIFPLSLGSPFSLGLVVGLYVPLLVVPRLGLGVELSGVAEQSSYLPWVFGYEEAELGQDRETVLPHQPSSWDLSVALVRPLSPHLVRGLPSNCSPLSRTKYR